MKVSRKRLLKIIREEIATVKNDVIDDTVMNVLSDEGGAAGLEPIEAALEDLEDEEIGLPDESIEDIIGSVSGVKRHTDGDYVDTTQLESLNSRNLRLTENELRLIIRESLEEGKFADIMRGVGKHGSKLLTRPAGIIAKALGRLAGKGDSADYEDRIDKNVEGLEKLIGDLLYLPGRGLEMGYSAFEKLMYKAMPDLHPDEIKKLHKEIDEEKKKLGSKFKEKMGFKRSGQRGRSRMKDPRSVPMASRLATENMIREIIKGI
jgi:hypothetical protein